MLKIPLRAAAIAAAIMAAAAFPARAQADRPGAAAAPDPVVAKLGDRDIRLSELGALQDRLPEQYRRMPLEQLFEGLRRQLVDTVLIARAAEAEGLDREPEVARQIEASRQSTLRAVYVARIIEGAVSEEALRTANDGLKERSTGQSEIRASHILVATEREALAVIAELGRPGADFAALARSRSTGPSSARGGDLGFFGRGDMVKPFADAAFALQPGEVSQKPVQTQFGWHVIRVDERRPVPVPSFEDAVPQLREEVAERAIAALIETLRTATPVQHFNIDGTPERPSGIRRAPR